MGGTAVSETREKLLEHVRHAVKEGNRAGHAPPLPERGNTGYQGSGSDPVSQFCDACTAAGGNVHRAATAEAALACVLDLVQSREARRVLLSRDSILKELGLAEQLRDLGIEVWRHDEPDSGNARDSLFSAEIGITGVDYLIAETGSVVVASRPDHPRSLSLLPPVHIAIARREQIVPDLFDLLNSEKLGNPDMLPSCLTLITGPSKTGDIELRLVTGVHGPGEVLVVLID
jgi:L-lactate dehydrogenase complex protein LldG